MQQLIDLIFKNPIFKIIGIGLILYFGLYANKTDPDSLGNRLSPQKIKENTKKAKEKSFFILKTLQEAKKHNKDQ